MRVYFSPIVAIFVALSLVSGTVGCRNTGGPWYNPSTYAFSNPFGKDRPASPGSSSIANKKPSLGAQPNISAAPGGYTDGSSMAASPASSSGTVSSTPPSHWSQHSPTMQQASPNSYGGYTVADPSQYSPQTYSESYGGQGTATPYHQYSATQGQQQSPYQQYPQEAVQQAHSYPAMPYGEQNAQTVYQTTSAYQQQPMHNVPAGSYGGMEQPSPYGYNGVAHPGDPYAGMQQMQQPTAVPPSGFGQEQTMPSTYAYPGEGVSVASPYQPYQPPAASGAHSY
jgi:hypothetical protein